MATERQSPDGGIFVLTALTGAYTDVDDDPDSPDGLWLIADSNNVNTGVEASFPTPTGNPTVGADLQEFRVLFRQFDEGQGGTPEGRIELWENGGLIRAGSDIGIPDGGIVISFPWNASELATANGSLVECKAVGTKSGGSPGNRNSTEVGAIEWNVAYDVGGVTHYGSTTLSGTGLLATIGCRIYAGKVTLVGIGSLVGKGVGIFAGKVTLSGTGVLSALGGLIKYGVATLSGSGLFSAIGGVFKLGTATLSGIGSLTVSAVSTLIGKVTLTGTGDLSVLGRLLFSAKTTLSGVGSLVASGALVKYGIATLTGIGSLTTSAVAIFVGKVTLSGTGLLSAIGNLGGGGWGHKILGISNFAKAGGVIKSGIKKIMGIE